MTTKPTSTALTKVEQDAVTTLNEISENQLGEHLRGLPTFEYMVTQGKLMKAIRDALEPLMPGIMQNAGHPLYFQMDRQSYPADVIRDCLVEAVVQGVQPYGNEFNIISGRCYITKSGLQRLVGTYPGLTDLQLDFDVPHMKGEGAVVDAEARWRLHGAPQSLKRSIPVRVNKGMGADAILGKATRKLLASVWDRITGSRVSIPEGEVGDPELVVEATVVHADVAEEARTLIDFDEGDDE
jgi:hypothetical protein